MRQLIERHVHHETGEVSCTYQLDNEKREQVRYASEDAENSNPRDFVYVYGPNPPAPVEDGAPEVVNPDGNETQLVDGPVVGGSTVDAKLDPGTPVEVAVGDEKAQGVVSPSDDGDAMAKRVQEAELAHEDAAEKAS